MAESKVEIPWVLLIEQWDWDKLKAHHFPGDDDEHGSVLVCGVACSERERRLLVREVVLAQDGQDYLPSKTAYRALSPAFISEWSGYCEERQLAYLAVHNHFAKNRVDFSHVDLGSHEKNYPSLLDITRGGPVGWLVLGTNAVAGDIYTPEDRTPVAKTIVLGTSRRTLLPKPNPGQEHIEAMYDRQARLFGKVGQALLGQLKVGVIGAGGGGSLITQGLSRLGVGEIVNIDDDIIEETNRPRVVGSRLEDVKDKNLKVEVACRVALEASPTMCFQAIDGNIAEEVCAQQILDCDALFLAADSMTARHVLNAICHQYLIPGFQVGAKVSTAKGQVTDAFAVSRIVGPGAACMWCSGLISATKLGEEAYSPEERQKMQYGTNEPQPSVITLNMMSAALALNDFLFMFIGLHQTNDVGARRYSFLTREPELEEPVPTESTCHECHGRKALGDRGGIKYRLPLRLSR